MAVACIRLPDVPSAYELTLPGMGTLSYLQDTLESVPRPSSMLLKFLNSMSPALGWVNNVIRIVDMVQAITNCINSIPRCFMTLSPGPLIQCFEKLFQALAALIQLVPPMPYIRMIVDIVVLVRYLVDDLLNLVGVIDREISRIKAAMDEGQRTGDADLIEIGECARDNLNQQMAGFRQIVELLGKLINLVLSIMDSIATYIPGGSEKVAEWREDIGGAIDDAGAAQADIAGFIMLGPLVTCLTNIRNVLVIVEQFGKAILGMPFSLPDFEELVLENS